MHARRIFALFLLTVSTPLLAGPVSCKQTPTGRFCHSSPHMNGMDFYFFATDDTGLKSKLIFGFGGQENAQHPDAVVVALDNGRTLSLRAEGMPVQPDCPNQRCTYTVGAVADADESHLAAIAAATSMQVSYVAGHYTSKPISVDPQRITYWISQWRARGTAPESQP